MSGQGRPLRLGWAAPLAAILSLVLTSTSAVAADPRSYIRPMQEDAELTDVCFVDAERGWAVGDRGVIWRTTDGGKRWELQDSGVTCRLESVHFIDADNGWAAGGASHPYTHVSRGALLRSRDGGRTWQQEKSLLLPAIKQIKFFNGAQGWALGESSALYASGLFWTENGGRSWNPVMGPGLDTWVTGDFLDSGSGMVGGRRGLVAAVRQRGLVEAKLSNVGLRNLRRIKFAAPAGGWLVGDGGLVAWTDDVGRTWQVPPADPAGVVGRDVDWLTVETRGQRVWIAGSPGTRVLHTADGGRSWQAWSTGQNLPILDLAFIDNDHGWAVGALGLILSTTDGGRTWHRQRSTATRAAVLGLFSEPDRVPLELFARLSGNEGYLSAVGLIARRDLEVPQPASDTLADRARDALAAVGTSRVDTAWGFPLRQDGIATTSDQFVSAWDRANEQQAVQHLENWLVRQIRLWRPEVIITEGASPRGDDALGHTINQIVLRAAAQAAETDCCPEHLARLGLAPWRTRKVFGSLRGGQLSTLNLSTSQMAASLGCSLADIAEDARSLLADHYDSPPTTLGFQLLVDHVPQGAGGHDFLSGVSLNSGGEARRSLGENHDPDGDLMRRANQKHRTLQAIMTYQEKRGHDTAQLLGQLREMIAGVDPASAGQLLVQVGQQYFVAGRWEMAAETFNLLASQYPDHPATEAALVWLLHYYSSSEIGWQVERPQRNGSIQTSFARPLGALPLGAELASGQVTPAAAQLSARDARSHVQQAVANEPTSAQNRWQRAAVVAKFLEQSHPTAFAEPGLLFPLAVVHRSQGLARQSEKFYQNFSRTRPHDAWWSCAVAEQWLAESGKDAPPKNVWRASRSASRPKLDGQLDETLWQQASPIELRSAQHDDAEWSAVALAAIDQEFLYIAVTCHQAPGCDYTPSKQRRPRDPDLSQRDRVEIFLDLDRDWATSYRLVIDHRGWVAEDCCSSKSWNPAWFVAAATEDGTWTVEAAMPLEELARELPKPRDVWAVGVQRTVPGVGFQSWTQPAATTVIPAGFGYMVFE